MILIDGRKAREHFLPILKDRIESSSIFYPNAGTPCLAIIQVGSRADSDSFIKAKKSFAEKLGVKEIHIKLKEDVKQDEVIKNIKKFNKDKSIHGIIVQLPLPAHLDSDKIISTIISSKDVDGLTKGSPYLAATARGISQLFSYYKINLSGKDVTIVGRSKLVGTPIAEMCKKAGAKITICHKETRDVPSITLKSDIVIIATGQPKFFTKNYFKEGQIVIDVGISRVDDELVGDVDFEKVKNIAKMITPVPGGVGAMTVLALFENVVDAWYNQSN